MFKEKWLFKFTTKEKRNCNCKRLQEKEKLFSEMIEKIKTRYLDKMCKFLFGLRTFHTQMQPDEICEISRASRLSKT